MSTDNEKLFDSYQDGGANKNDEKNSSATSSSEEGYGRREDSRPYRPRIQRSAPSSYDRPSRPSYNRSGNDRPSYGNDRPSYGNSRPSYGNDRPSYGNSRPSYGNDRPSYGNDRSSSYGNNSGYNGNDRNNEDSSRRPRINPVDSENAYRPRYNGNSERPQYNNYNNSRSNNRYSRTPYQSDNSESGGQQRPSFRPQGSGYNNGGNGGYSNPGRSNGYNSGGGYQNRGGYQQRGPRFNSNNQGGYGAQRPTNGFRRPSDGYDPNAKYSIKKQIEYKEKNYDPDELLRLNKYLANAGVCSRREADAFIQAGVVSVNGAIVTELGTKVKRSDEIKFHEDRVSVERKVYVILNKPKDCVTTSDDPQARKTVMEFVKGACKERIYPVGRLDRNTTGVLLLTNDGDMASKLTHPKFMKKKVYQVTLDKTCQQGDLDRIATGVELEDGTIQADAVGYSDEGDKRQVGIEIHSGKNRIVRRIFESLGYRVLKLDRVLFAGLTKKGLRRGDWRFLTEVEVNTLRMGAFE